MVLASFLITSVIFAFQSVGEPHSVLGGISKRTNLNQTASKVVPAINCAEGIDPQRLKPVKAKAFAD